MAVDLEKYAFSFSHAIIKINDRQFTAISNVSMSQDIERAAVFGTSRAPLKRSAGQASLGEGSLTFSDIEEASEFHDALEDPSLDIFAVDVTLSNEAGDVRSYEALSCALSGFSIDLESGADALSQEVPFSFMRVKINGKVFVK